MLPRPFWREAKGNPDEAQFQTCVQMWQDPLLPWLTEAGREVISIDPSK